MHFIDYLGLVAGALTTLGLIPQVVRVFKLKSAREISILFNTTFLLGILFWITYGIFLSLVPVILWNALTAVLIALLLYAKLQYGK